MTQKVIPLYESVSSYCYSLLFQQLDCYTEHSRLEKRLEIETLTAQCSALKEENCVLIDKVKGVKARSYTLEKEVAKYKQQIQLLLNKTNTDDELIDALKTEMTHLRVLVTGSNTTKPTCTQEQDTAERMEIRRLNRICRQQANQLMTQDEIIRELRSQITK